MVTKPSGSDIATTPRCNSIQSHATPAESESEASPHKVWPLQGCASLPKLSTLVPRWVRWSWGARLACHNRGGQAQTIQAGVMVVTESMAHSFERRAGQCGKP